MRSNARDFRIRNCIVCEYYEVWDEHHIYADILGKNMCSTVILCPNHHRLAHIFQNKLAALNSIHLVHEIITNLPNDAFIEQFVDRLISTLVHEHRRLNKLSSMLGEILLYFRGDLTRKILKELNGIDKELEKMSGHLKEYQQNHSHLMTENRLDEVEEELKIREAILYKKNQKIKLMKKLLEIENTYSPKLRDIIESLEAKNSKKFANSNHHEGALKQEQEVYLKFCRVFGWEVNGYSKIIWNELINQCIEQMLGEDTKNKESFVKLFTDLAQKLPVTKF